jgi:hypothetical protein
VEPASFRHALGESLRRRDGRPVDQSV